MAYSNPSEAIETLAAEIGERIYIDVANWHLYLREAHLHTPLAERFYPMMESNDLNEQAVRQVLAATLVDFGGGKTRLPLSEIIPTPVQADLVEFLENYQREL
jgi:hypothetical protein